MLLSCTHLQPKDSNLTILKYIPECPFPHLSSTPFIHVTLYLSFLIFFRLCFFSIIYIRYSILPHDILCGPIAYSSIHISYLNISPFTLTTLNSFILSYPQSPPSPLRSIYTVYIYRLISNFHPQNSILNQTILKFTFAVSLYTYC